MDIFQKVDPNDKNQLETLSGTMVHLCFNINIEIKKIWSDV